MLSTKVYTCCADAVLIHGTSTTTSIAAFAAQWQQMPVMWISPDPADPIHEPPDGISKMNVLKISGVALRHDAAWHDSPGTREHASEGEAPVLAITTGVNPAGVSHAVSVLQRRYPQQPLECFGAGIAGDAPPRRWGDPASLHVQTRLVARSRAVVCDSSAVRREAEAFSVPVRMIHSTPREGVLSKSRWWPSDCARIIRGLMAEAHGGGPRAHHQTGGAQHLLEEITAHLQ